MSKLIMFGSDTKLSNFKYLKLICMSAENEHILNCLRKYNIGGSRMGIFGCDNDKLICATPGLESSKLGSSYLILCYLLQASPLSCQHSFNVCFRQLVMNCSVIDLTLTLEIQLIFLERYLLRDRRRSPFQSTWSHFIFLSQARVFPVVFCRCFDTLLFAFI